MHKALPGILKQIAQLYALFGAFLPVDQNLLWKGLVLAFEVCGSKHKI